MGKKLPISFHRFNCILYIAYHSRWKTFAVSRLPSFPEKTFMVTSFYKLLYSLAKIHQKFLLLWSNPWKTRKIFTANNKQYMVFLHGCILYHIRQNFQVGKFLWLWTKLSFMKTFCGSMDTLHWYCQLTRPYAAVWINSDRNSYYIAIA